MGAALVATVNALAVVVEVVAVAVGDGVVANMIAAHVCVVADMMGVVGVVAVEVVRVLAVQVDAAVVKKVAGSFSAVAVGV